MVQTGIFCGKEWDDPETLLGVEVGPPRCWSTYPLVVWVYFFSLSPLGKVHRKCLQKPQNPSIFLILNVFVGFKIIDGGNRCNELARINSRIPTDYVVYPFVSCWFGYPKLIFSLRNCTFSKVFGIFKNVVSIYPWLVAVDETTTVNSNLQLGTRYHWDKWSSICWNFSRDPLLTSWSTATGFFAVPKLLLFFVSNLGISCTTALFLLDGSASKHVPIPVVKVTDRGVNPTYNIYHHLVVVGNDFHVYPFPRPAEMIQFD